MTLAVEAEGLVKQYSGRGGTVEAVRGVDLRVGTGEVFGFLGPNGAGGACGSPMFTWARWNRSASGMTGA